MSFTVFPDPADDRITIEMNRNSDGWTGATILSIQGKTMVHRMFKDQDIFVVDVASLPAGLYFIRIQTADGVATRKLFIR
jgi:hypothetical protein